MANKLNNILVVEDRADVRLSLSLLLEDNGYQYIEAENPQVAQLKLKQYDISLILLDMNFTMDTTSGKEGLDFLNWLQHSSFNQPLIAMTAWSNTDIVVQAMKLGANDFIEKPWRNKQLLHAIQQQLDLCSLQRQNTKLKQQLLEPCQQAYQWHSPCMQDLFKKIDAIAATDVSVLLTGDNGTGKSELARYIHQKSQRATAPFVAVNMGAIAETLFESEMFGHKKGAFTDAKQERIGRFELAEKGTLFLDEIANIPLSQQAKILRVLENGEFELLGSSHTKKTNTRIISATNANFSQLIAKEVFREDLYYRLNTIEFVVPPLKTRCEDIIPLAEFFITKYACKYKLNINILSAEAKQALVDYQWPGNVREMSHIIERGVLLSERETLSVADLNLSLAKQSSVIDGNTLPFMTLQQAEVNLIMQALEKTKQHIPKAANLLGLTKASMYRRLEKYGIAKS